MKLTSSLLLASRFTFRRYGKGLLLLYGSTLCRHLHHCLHHHILCWGPTKQHSHLFVCVYVCERVTREYADNWSSSITTSFMPSNCIYYQLKRRRLDIKGGNLWHSHNSISLNSGGPFQPRIDFGLIFTYDSQLKNSTIFSLLLQYHIHTLCSKIIHLGQLKSVVVSIFNEVLYLRTILRYLYFTWIFLLSATLFFYSSTIQS